MQPRVRRAGWGRAGQGRAGQEPDDEKSSLEDGLCNRLLNRDCHVSQSRRVKARGKRCACSQTAIRSASPSAAPRDSEFNWFGIKPHGRKAEKAEEATSEPDAEMIKTKSWSGQQSCGQREATTSRDGSDFRFLLRRAQFHT